MRRPTLEKNLDFFSLESNITPRAEFTELNTYALVRVILPLCSRQRSDCASLLTRAQARWGRHFVSPTAPPQGLRHTFFGLNAEWMRRLREKMDKALPSGGRLSTEEQGRFLQQRPEWGRVEGPTCAKARGLERVVCVWGTERGRVANEERSSWRPRREPEYGRPTEWTQGVCKGSQRKRTRRGRRWGNRAGENWPQIKDL